MLLRATPGGLIVRDDQSDLWVSLPVANAYLPTGDALLEAETNDMLAFLAGGEAAREAAAAAVDAARRDPAARADPSAATLPFRPRSLRAFMLFESHVVQSARMLVKHFFPAPVARAMETYERVDARHVPAAEDRRRRFYERPDVLRRQPHDGARRRRADVVAVATRERSTSSWSWRSCSRGRSPTRRPQEAAAAIGGWFVLNDWSARDVQADDARHAIFGPVVKAKTFANSLGCDVLTADARARLAADARARAGRRRAVVRGHDRRRRSTTSARCWPTPRRASGSAPATSSRPARCPAAAGWSSSAGPRPGQTVELEIDGIGTLTNRIDPAAGPRSLP